MAKTPFEKVRSLLERRKLFEQVIQMEDEIVCKSEDSLFKLKPKKIVDGKVLHSEVVVIEQTPTNNSQTVGNFALREDRYFFSGSLAIQGSRAELPLSCDVFILQRRASFRVNTPPSLGLFLAMTEFQGGPVYLTIPVADISTGGARVYFGDVLGVGVSQDPGLMMGSRFKAVIHPPSKKTIEVLCEVKHLQKMVLYQQMVTQYGLEFIELNQSQKNRLLALTMDLQRALAVQFEP